MKSLFKNISLAFAAGAVGGLANALVLWLFGAAGVIGALDVRLTWALSLASLYRRVVWGGLWGGLFLLPLKKRIGTGLLFSLGPSAAALFYFIPSQPGGGVLGLGFGSLTPLLVLFFNAIWGLAAIFWLNLAGGVKEE